LAKTRTAHHSTTRSGTPTSATTSRLTAIE
jgi:hypothetical protein